MNTVQKIVQWSSYPLTLAISFFLLYEFIILGFTPSASAVIAVLFGAAIVALLEIYLPYRTAWRENLTDFSNDAAYMLFVQILLPRLLVFILSMTLLNYLSTHELTFEFLWPHHLPIYAQAMLMLCTADLLRYWLHRATHQYGFLWKLHKVHHSPKKLYWVNTGRFHPIEKMLQVSLDTLPFLVLGVPPEVLAAYFTFYSVNGFFQHCNIDLKFGFLKYIISSPVLHRWHHSVIIKEGNKNFGSNLIIWDLMFGSWYAPKDREVDELGIPDKAYPLDFLHQQIAPFTRQG